MLCLRVNEPRRFFRKHRLTLCRGVVRFYARLKDSRSSVELHRGERRAWNEQSRMTTMLRSVRRNSLSANFVKSARYVSTFFARRVESQHSPRRDHVLRRWLATVGGRVPSYNNEPILEFKKGSPEREEVYEAYRKLKEGPPADIPCVVGGEEIRTGNVRQQVAPFDHRRTVTQFHWADTSVINKAIETSLAARAEWDLTPFEHRAAVFLKAADLISTKYRSQMLAATMIGQGKNLYQAEIDSTCELIDFYRFAVQFASELLDVQPLHHSPTVWNRLVCRGLEGFVAAISPFNFTAIGGNLAGIPALLGNAVLWKPSDTSVLANWLNFQILREAGLPDGVINFLPADGPVFGDAVTKSPDLALVNFTGSTKTFKHLWRQVGNNIDNYRTFPRMVGECGGKNFHLLHPTADVGHAVDGTVRSAFEYAGQKCSACSRAYIPESLWPKVKEGLLEATRDVSVGPPDEPQHLYSSVIDDKSFGRIKAALSRARTDSELTVLAGGNCSDSVGYVVEPTIIQTSNPKHDFMQTEFFGPILTVYVYKDSEWDSVLKLVDNTSPYSLTGSVYARDRTVIEQTQRVLRQSTGNFYINDKSTGSVVGQQPFGGARSSGTNDKAGAPSYMLKYVSLQSVKETFVPTTSWSHPSMKP